MAYKFEADIDFQLADMGVPFTHAAEAGYAIVDSTEELVLSGWDSKLAAEHIQATIKTSTFPTLKEGDTVTCDSVSYIVAGQRLRIEDGALTKVLLRRSSAS